jgi:phage terminase large subunit
LKVQIPQKILLAIQQTRRNLILFGGRGSGKSQSVARILLAEAFKNKIRILCCREIQNSIADSVHSLLKDIINECNEYQEFFKITEKEITGLNGSQFIFKGLKKETAGSIKSIEGINVCWIEEAQFISRFSLDILIPTIRKENSKIIFTMNPTNDDDPVYVDYVLPIRDDTVKCLSNWNDNPFFPEVLKFEKDYDKKHDIDKYNHVWEGLTVKHSESQVFKGKWIIDDFITPNDAEFYHGVDWGFANDATCMIRCFIKNECLYIDKEVYGVGIELDAIANEFDKIETARKWQIYADNSRPETISYIARQGFKIKPCDKWQGSIEDGVEYIKKFKRIIIHSECKNMIYEMKTYCYKTDRLTGKILPVIIDANNHLTDSLRYGINDLIKNKIRIIQPTNYSAGSLGL